MGKDEEEHENETPNESEKGRVESDESDSERRRANPDPASEPIFKWLEQLFHAPAGALDEGRSGWPQKIVLTVPLGAKGTRPGPSVLDIPFLPKKNQQKPNRPRLVELSNEFLSAAQADCDALNRPTRYGLFAYDSRRSDRSYSRFLFKLAPTELQTPLEMERGVGVGALDEEEGGALSTKLLFSLLADERQKVADEKRDRRWQAEMTMNVLSGVINAQRDELERLRAHDNARDKSRIEYMQAMETMLSQASDRKIAGEWSAWKREQLSILTGKALSYGELLLPTLAGAKNASSASSANSDASSANSANSESRKPNPLTTLLTEMTMDEGVRLFGKGGGGHVAGAIFSDEQFQAMSRLSEATAPDPADVAALKASITSEQIKKAVEVLGTARLLPLYQWLTQVAQ